MRLYRSNVCAPLDLYTNAANSKRMISRCRVRRASWPQPKRTLGLSHLLQRRCMRSRCTIPAYFVVYFLDCILDHQAMATKTPGNHVRVLGSHTCVLGIHARLLGIHLTISTTTTGAMMNLCASFGQVQKARSIRAVDDILLLYATDSYVCAPLDPCTNAENRKMMISSWPVRRASWRQPKRTLGLSLP